MADVDVTRMQKEANYSGCFFV